MIGFILSHDAGAQELYVFIVAIERFDAITGLDFFSELPDDLESRFEAEIYIDL